MRCIVSDTGPLLHLHEIQALDLLKMAGQIHIPSGVAAEMALRETSWSTPAWVCVETLDHAFELEAMAWQRADLLDVGEAEGIALARQLKADWFLTDDAAARIMAQALSLEVHGSLGIVLWAAATTCINRGEAEALLKRLAQSSLRFPLSWFMISSRCACCFARDDSIS